ncbi:putative TAM domain methyltransferase [Ascobolus immersus RN42]|uniref:Putative TAM domain methyltransferase n=1 Tax=Ascobolus immersus RN42 TaxID=1160509 RepID=A0A3N4I844_ASCIM|nr:putative TAM domain methyltransferase [Ascobolus immersus RN42]
MSNAHGDEHPIEIGTEDDESCYGSSIGSDTTSLSSSVFDYVYENGRRYASQRSGNYLLPNDEIEQERLDMFHHMYNLILRGELHLAPITERPLRRVLDLGTGTGVWAVDMGDLYPEAEILGTDLSPIQPNWVPPNVKFEVDDFELEWAYKKDEAFDYIHGRGMLGAVKDWQALANQCYENLVPGGYVEFQESAITEALSDDGTHAGTRIETYSTHVEEASRIAGTNLHLVSEIDKFLKNAGFVNVTKRVIKAPVGNWPKDPRFKEIGKIFLAIGMSGVEAYGLALLTRVLKWSEKDAKELIKGVCEDLSNRKIHVYYPQ